MTSRVLVLHGLWNAKSWVAPLALRLRDGEPVNLVGHSLGGLIGLEALRREPSLPVPRLVCIGSPLSGSRTAAVLAARAWMAPVLGRSRALLQRGCEPWTGPTEIGMVAGNVARGVGRLLACLEGDSDGTVAVSETRLPGLRDHCVVPASHSGLVLSRAAAVQTACFLRQGRFAADPALGGAGALE